MKFECIKGPFFLKKKFPVIYKNSGSNFTLQAFYELIPDYFESLRKKTVLIYDVPDYFDINKKIEDNFIKKKIIREYDGYLIDLKGYSSTEDYIKTRFNSKNRSQFRSYERKLERSFLINYEMYSGYISEKKFNTIFEYFYELSVKSFKVRKISNKKLLPKNIAFLREVTYKLINDGKACLFVVYDTNVPIGICLNFNSNNILFGDSTVYDSNYSKFNIGTIMLIKQIEWCITNNYEVYDFSKAYFPYKEKWCNRKYYFHYHILFDSRNFKSYFTASLLAYYFRLKQHLREHPLRTFLKKMIG